MAISSRIWLIGVKNESVAKWASEWNLEARSDSFYLVSVLIGREPVKVSEATEACDDTHILKKTNTQVIKLYYRKYTSKEETKI